MVLERGPRESREERGGVGKREAAIRGAGSSWQQQVEILGRADKAVISGGFVAICMSFDVITGVDQGYVT